MLEPTRTRPPIHQSLGGVVMEVRLNEFFTIGTTRVFMEKKHGQVARLRIVAEVGTVITRPERVAHW